MNFPLFPTSGFVVAVSSLLVVLGHCHAEAGPRHDIVEVEEDGVLILYQVIHSGDGSHYARNELLFSFDGSTAPLIEVFSTRTDPDPATARDPIWRTNIPGAREIYLGNSGRKIVALHQSLVRAPGSRRFLPAGRYRQTAVTEVDAGEKSRAVTRTRVRSVTKRVRRVFRGIIVGGDAIVLTPNRSTYTWLRNSRQVGDIVRVRGYGGGKTFSLRSRFPSRPASL